MHGLVALFLEVIVLAIILLVVGLVVPCVLVVALPTIMALIISMMIVRLAIIAITSVALMVVTIFVAMVLLVAQFTATCSIGCFLSMEIFARIASRHVGCLTLLEEGNHSERVDRHCLVQVGELVLVCLRLREEDLFTLLLRCEYLYCST